MRDGQRVSYIGFDADGLVLGDQGRVISAGQDYSHVMWSTGTRVNCVDLVEDVNLVPTAKARANTVAAHLVDSLDVGPLVTLAVRETLDESGEAGLLNALNDSGHLSSLGQIAEDALEFVASRLRADGAFGEVLAQLDQNEASSLVSLASSVLLRDASEMGETDDN